MLNSAKSWPYYVKINLQDINMTPKEHLKQSGVVAVDSCFAIIVFRQDGVTNREALLKNNILTLI